MPSITVRNVPDAAQHGRSIEAEMRSILEQAARPARRLKIGSLIASISAETGGLNDAEHEIFNRVRDKTPAAPVRFE